MASKTIKYRFGADLSALERGWKQIDRGLRGIARKSERAGRAMSKALTAPLLAVGAAATKAALDVDKAMQGIARGTGATGAALRGLQKDWEQIAGKVSQNFEESSKAVADYNTRLGLTGEALQEMSRKALDAGRMMGEDVSALVAQSSKAIQDWGVSAENMGVFLDKIFFASQATGIGMGKLSGQMYKYGSALRQLGFTADGTLAMLAEFEKQGVNTRLVLGSLRQALGKMARGGIKDAGDAFLVLCEDIKQTGSDTEATRKALELFGAEAGADMAAAIREGRFEVDELAAALAGSQGAIQATSDATKTFGDIWGETRNSISMAIAPIGKEILTLANDIMPALQSKAEALRIKIADMSEDSRRNVLKMAVVLGAGGPLLLAISATINAVRNLGTTLVALASNPVVVAIAGIAALTAAMWDYWHAAEAVKAQARSVMSVMGVSGIGKAARIAGGLEAPDAFPEEYDKSKLSEIAPTLPGATPRPIQAPWIPTVSADDIWGKLSGGGSPKASSGRSAVAKARDEVAELVQSIRDKIRYLGADGSEFLPVLDKWQSKLTPLSEGWKRIADLQSEITGDAARATAEAQAAAAERAEQVWQDMQWDYFQGFLGGEEYFVSLRAEIDTLTAGTEEWKNRFSELQSVARDLAADQIREINAMLEDGKIKTEEWQEMIENLRARYAGIPSVVAQIDEAMSNAKDTSRDALDMVTMWANDLSRGLADALVKAKDLGDALRNIAKQIAASALQKALGGLLGGLFADGAAFFGGTVLAYANGGIVSSPTVFPMARGMGLMGEAGPEAIMPLRRGSDGRLGVEAQGGGGGTVINNHYHISAVDAKSFADLVARNPKAITSVVANNYHNNGALRKVIKGS